MAKAKAKGKAKAKANHNDTQTLPDGYKTLVRAPNWDMDANPVIAGIRGESTDVTFDRGTKEARMRRCCVVNDKTIGAVNVWESSYLKDFFDKTEEGDNVRIEFIGYGEAKEGQDPPKLFVVGVKGSKAPF